jgi:hypothetical protein
MQTKTLNLRLPLILNEIEAVLQAYPAHPYQQAFADSTLRQKLVDYTLYQASLFYNVVSDEQDLPPQSGRRIFEQRLYIQPLIRQGIQQILQKHSDWVNQYLGLQKQPTRS